MAQGSQFSYIRCVCPTIFESSSSKLSSHVYNINDVLAQHENDVLLTHGCEKKIIKILVKYSTFFCLCFSFRRWV